MAYLVSQGFKLTALTLSEEVGSSVLADLPKKSADLCTIFQGNAEKVAAEEARQVSAYLTSTDCLALKTPAAVIAAQVIVFQCVCSLHCAGLFADMYRSWCVLY